MLDRRFWWWTPKDLAERRRALRPDPPTLNPPAADTPNNRHYYQAVEVAANQIADILGNAFHSGGHHIAGNPRAVAQIVARALQKIDFFNYNNGLTVNGTTRVVPGGNLESTVTPHLHTHDHGPGDLGDVNGASGPGLGL